MEELKQFAIGSADWGEDLNRNMAILTEALTGLQEIGPLDVVAGSTFPDYYTKDEVNDLIAGANFSFFLSDTIDGAIGAYFQLFDADTGEVKSSVGPIAIVADGTLVKAFITEIGQPTFTVLSEGVISLDVHASTTVGANVKAAQLYFELYKRTQPGGVETLLVTSEVSEDLTVAEFHYTIHATLSEEINLLASDRLVVKVYGNVTGTEPADPDVTVFMEGTTASRISVQTTITAFDERYLQLSGALPMADDLDMDGNDIVNVGNRPLVFVDRGDPAAADKTHATLTADGAWHDWDLSAIAPAGTIAVSIQAQVQDNLVNQFLQFRKNGNVNANAVSYLVTQAAGIWTMTDVVVPCDTDRKIEYWLSNTVWSVISLTVKGWWIS